MTEAPGNNKFGKRTVEEQRKLEVLQARITLGERLTADEYAKWAAAYYEREFVELANKVGADAKLAEITANVFGIIAGVTAKQYKKHLALEDRIAELEKRLDGSAERSTPLALVAGRAS